MLGGVLIGDGPARGFVGLAKNLLLVEAVDFDNSAVGGEGKLRSSLVQFADGAENLFGTTDMPEPFMTRQAPSENLAVELFLGFQSEIVGLPQAVENDGEGAFRDFARIE